MKINNFINKFVPNFTDKSLKSYDSAGEICTLTLLKINLQNN